MKRKLSHISFESISECNLNCIYCYNHWKLPGNNTSFAYNHKKAVKTVQEIYKQANISHFTITGGEPLLNDYISEIILTAKINNSSVSIISNGNAGKNIDYALLKELDVNLIMFPVHSANPDIHDAMTRIKTSWENSINSVIKAISSGLYVVPVIVLTRLNFKEIKETLLFLDSMGLKRISVNRYNIGGAGINNAGISLNHSELRETFTIINQIAKDYKLYITSNVCTPFCVIEPQNYPYIGFGSCGNDQYKRPITLDINGNIKGCNHSPVIAGNIYNENIFEILEGEYIKSWNTIKPIYCQECSKFESCLGGCRAAAEQSGLSISHPDPLIFLNDDLFL